MQHGLGHSGGHCVAALRSLQLLVAAGDTPARNRAGTPHPACLPRPSHDVLGIDIFYGRCVHESASWRRFSTGLALEGRSGPRHTCPKTA